MDNVHEEAIDGESECRRTRSGRVVRTPTPSPKQTTRKTRKKMVLVEVEVSEDEEPEEVVPITNMETIDESPEELVKLQGAENSDSIEDIVMETSETEDAVGNGEDVEMASDIVELADEVEEIIENEEKFSEDVETAEDAEETAEDAEEEAEEIIEEIVEKVEEITKEVKKATEEVEEETEDVVEIIEDMVKEVCEEPAEELKNGVEETHSSSDTEDNDIVFRSENDDITEEDNTDEKEEKESQYVQPGEPDAENISEDELPSVQVAKVPETEEVSDEELPGPKRAELPADTEVVSEDELPTVKKEGTKRKLGEADYDPGSPTSESEVPSKKPNLETEAEKEKEEKKPKKLPELDKYWKAVNDDPADFTGWTYLLQYVDQENDMEAAREAYDAFLSHYPYCYGYWRKYADYEKRKGNKKKCEEVFERGLKAIPLSVDLWIHYLTYVKTTRPDEEEFIRSQFERALSACGLEFRSDRLWDSFMKWENEAKRLQNVTAIYDRLLSTPTQGYTSHFDNFQEHITSNPPNKVLEVDEFLALRKEVKHMLKHDTVPNANTDNPDIPPGEDDAKDTVSSDEETKAIRERIVSIRRKMHKNTVTAVTARWNFEEGIKRPYFHVKPLERCQLKNWQEYLDYEVEQGDQERIITLFERCLIACALYEEFWLRFVHYLEGLKDTALQQKIKDVYERACTIHHLKKPSLHLQWAMFEESVKNYSKAAEILVNLEKSVPNLLQVAYRRINLERRRGDFEKCSQLYEHYINNSKNKVISSNLAIKYARFNLKILENADKAYEVLNAALVKDACNQRLYLQLIDMSIQKESAQEVLGYMDSFLEKEAADIDQKVLFAQRKLEFLEDFGSDIQCVQKAYEEYQKYLKTSKEKKKDPAKSDTVSKKEKEKAVSSQSNSYGTYGNYNNSSSGSYPYSSSQGQYNYSQYSQGSDQYQYGNWQYPQGSYGGYNQWGGYSGGYGY